MSFSSEGNTVVMSSFGTNASKDNKTSFWKKNTKNVPGSIRPVYGAQHPPRHEHPVSATSGSNSQQSTPKKDLRKTRHNDSFQDFQDKTNDAWDDGDDDLILMANVKMSLRDVHSTAMQVITNHSQQAAAARAAEDMLTPIDGRITEPTRSASPSLRQSTPLGSAHSTPTHGTPSGPGVGVRQALPARSQRRLHQSHMPLPDREKSKLDKFKAIYSTDDMDLEDLRKLSWSGIPREHRPTTWKILSGYLPPSSDRRILTLERKRQEYFNFIDQYYDTRLQEPHKHTFRQIAIDIPRMSPLIPLFQQELVQQVFERILFIWAIRHPASGYVQGMNDLVTPFFVVFLSEHVQNDADIDNFDLASLPEEVVRQMEADSFWCYSKLLDGIQDNYTFAQPGIQTKVNALKDIISRINNELHRHLENQHVEYLQFSFRWMNNLLMREIPLRCTIRLWDSYLAESQDFASLHLYVCAAFILRFSNDLIREKDFQGLMLMLQNLPTHNWQNEEIGMLLAEAYRLKYMFADAPNHLAQKK